MDEWIEWNNDDDRKTNGPKFAVFLLCHNCINYRKSATKISPGHQITIFNNKKQRWWWWCWWWWYWHHNVRFVWFSTSNNNRKKNVKTKLNFIINNCLSSSVCVHVILWIVDNIWMEKIQNSRYLMHEYK